MNHLRNDTTHDPTDSLRWTWQQVRTPAARYSEALTYIQQGNTTAAEDAVEELTDGHVLHEAALAERQRMLDLITFCAGVFGDDRSMAQLTPTEQDQLEALVDGAYDRPAHRAQNILCFHYGLCRAPLTGGDPNRAPTIQNTPPRAPSEPSAWLRIHPNPASAWVAVDYNLGQEVVNATLLVRDLMGREIHRAALKGGTGQVIWDTRQVPAGSYALVLLGSSEGPITETLIVQP